MHGGPFTGRRSGSCASVDSERSVRIDSKGRVLIPADILRSLGFGPGDSVAGVPLPLALRASARSGSASRGPEGPGYALPEAAPRIRARGPGPQETGSVAGFRQDTLDATGNDVRGRLRRQSESGPWRDYSVDKIPTSSQSPHKLSTRGNNRKTLNTTRREKPLRPQILSKKRRFRAASIDLTLLPGLRVL